MFLVRINNFLLCFITSFHQYLFFHNDLRIVVLNVNVLLMNLCKKWSYFLLEGLLNTQFFMLVYALYYFL